MAEIKRVLLSPRRLLVLLAVVLVCLWWGSGTSLRLIAAQNRSYQQALIDKYAGMTLEEAMEDMNVLTDNGSYLTQAYSSTYSTLQYLISYTANLQAIQGRAEIMSTVSIFAGSPYSQANIRKTADDYSALEGLSLELGLNNAENALMQDSRSDYLIALWMLLVVYAFLDERRRGLWNVVCSSARGRGALPVWRLCTVALAAVLGCVAVTFTEVATAYQVYGGWDQMGRWVQSIPIFGNFTIPMTILQFWFFYTGVRILCTFALGMAIWLVFELVSDRRLAAGVLVGILLLEYSLSRNEILATLASRLNLFSWIHPRELMLSYNNLNLFGTPVGQIPLVLWGAVAMIAIASGIILVRYRLRRPTDGYAWIDRIRELLQRLTAPLGYHTGLLRHVLHQILFVGKGLLLLAAALVLVLSITSAAYLGSSDKTEIYYEQYLRQSQGLLTQDTWDYLENLKLRLEEDTATLEQLNSQLQAGEIDQDTYESLAYRYSDLFERGEALEMYQEYLARISTVENAYVMPQWVYEYLFDVDGGNSQSLLTLCLLAVLLVFLFQSGAENRSGMAKSQQATPLGRGRLRACQHISAWLVTAVFCIIVWTCQIMGLWNAYGGLPTIQAPACCLDFLQDKNPGITILQHWIWLAMGRTLLTCVFSSVILLVTGGLQRKR